MARQKTSKRASKQIKSRRRLFLPYPLAIFLLICAGVYLIAATFNVNAADVLVKAKVSAPFVTDPAVITTPTDGTHFNSIPITVSGTCPANAGYVEVFRNNVMGGTAICDANNEFTLSMDLFAGQNDLVARVFNITDDEGPVSNTVTVYYDVPQPPPSAGGSQPSGSSRTPTAANNPFLLNTEFIYKGFYTGEEVSWPIQISGGSPPYAISVDWGDGSTDVISRGSAGQFDIHHKYSSPGGYKGSYTVKIKAADNDENTAFLQFFVIINNKIQITSSTGSIFNKPTPNLGNKSWLKYVWPGYLLLLLLVVSYWLGEREELLILKKRGMLKRAR